MREIVLVAAGLLIGGFFGVTTMCLFQINRDRHYIYRKDSDKNEQEKQQKEAERKEPEVSKPEVKNAPAQTVHQQPKPKSKNVKER